MHVYVPKLNSGWLMLLVHKSEKVGTTAPAPLFHLPWFKYCMQPDMEQVDILISKKPGAANIIPLTLCI